MNVIYIKRNGGKTTGLVHLLQADPKAILLVCTSREARRIIDNYRETNLLGRVMSWGYYFNHPRVVPMMDVHLLIDNVDLYLQEKFTFQIEAVSINEDS